MKNPELSTALATISYEIESVNYKLSKEAWQLEVFIQLEKDANLVGLDLNFGPNSSLEEKYEVLKEMLTDLLMHGDVRSFLYRIDVSENKIRQIGGLSVDDLCILVLEREFRKVCIRRHFSS